MGWGTACGNSSIMGSFTQPEAARGNGIAEQAGSDPAHASPSRQDTHEAQ